MLMKRRSFLKTATGAATAPLFAAPRTRRPNVLFVIADEWRAQATGYNGDANVTTPVLDKLAKEVRAPQISRLEAVSWTLGSEGDRSHSQGVPRSPGTRDRMGRDRLRLAGGRFRSRARA